MNRYYLRFESTSQRTSGDGFAMPMILLLEAVDLRIYRLRDVIRNTVFAW